MLISLVMVVILEAKFCQSLGHQISNILFFLKGKRSIVSNIFLGIFASAFCMEIGEIINYKYMKKDLKNEINNVYDNLFVKMHFKKDDYISKAGIIEKYGETIQRLYKEYDSNGGEELQIIYNLDTLLKCYNVLYENEYMKNSNEKLFSDLKDEILKASDGDLHKLYVRSVTDEDAMKVRRIFEHCLNKQIKYEKQCEEKREVLIKQIVEIENELRQIYDDRNKQKKSS